MTLDPMHPTPPEPHDYSRILRVHIFPAPDYADLAIVDYPTGAQVYDPVADEWRPLSEELEQLAIDVKDSHSDVTGFEILPHE